ncbi:MAG TPA: cysteine--1-D-myo-inosityl 2-amino-2-deoxy-alpha-D-glucopyranoside ligase [Candidatus Luteococcus avicola]|nr:cysteine--1-D-myo-inosityl 2-amino-2-deoxy-alpha-D-glucopyranoside ligase [Candidatus Luteococcus avicola]
MKAWPAPVVPTLELDTPGAPGAVQVHDTSAGHLVPVGPEQGTARMYVCGITPYDATHLGHANTYLAFDLLQRAWRDLGLAVSYTQNVTDVDDPLLERAQQTGQDWTELAQEQTDLFRTDMTALRVIPPDDYVGAVESIDQVVTLIETLRASGAVYQVDDAEFPDWYFRCDTAPGFGEVSNLTDDEMMARFTEMGGDPERPGKVHPLDCLVWRMAREDEPSWPSSLGAGRPGWHIECSSIALETLGTTFDVQGGGSDLAFPHHEMSAAEGRVATGELFAKAYVHSGMVALDGHKMSKSRGNLELVSRLRGQGVDPMVVRLALLGHHYRNDWEWTADQIAAAQQRLHRWRSVVAGPTGVPALEAITRARTAIRTDLDAPAAIAALEQWFEASGSAEGDNPAAREQVRIFVDAVLGIEL